MMDGINVLMEWFKWIYGEIGFANTVFFFFLVGAHWWIYRLYEGRLSDRQMEIDRIAKENHEYREKFFQIIIANMRDMFPKDDNVLTKKTKRRVDNA